MTHDISYKEGVAAHRAGQLVGSNPYPNGSKATEVDKSNRTEWYSGWYDSHFQQKCGYPWATYVREGGRDREEIRHD